jgi:hypothetical protein
MAEEAPQFDASAPVRAAKKGNGKDALLCIKDPESFEIKLDLDTWDKHIIVGHPEIKEYLEKVCATISEPEVIQRSPTQAETFMYYRLTGRAMTFTWSWLFAGPRKTRRDSSKPLTW